MNNRKKQVIEQALSLFLEKGFQQTSIAEIISESNISKGTFYNYFASKNELLEAIFENVRYEASLLRTELSIGKNLYDLDVLAEQITALTLVRKQSGISVIMEEILHGRDVELKRYVLKYRMQELEWLSVRLQQIFNISNRTKAFEAAVLFYGMQLNMLFIGNIIEQNNVELSKFVKQHLHYTSLLCDLKKNEEETLLDPVALQNFLQTMQKIEMDEESSLYKLRELSSLSTITKQQQEISMALLEEILLEKPRVVVIEALLKRFIVEFTNSEFFSDAREIAAFVWYKTNQNSN